jgi:hypothetical protein
MRTYNVEGRILFHESSSGIVVTFVVISTRKYDQWHLDLWLKHANCDFTKVILLLFDLFFCRAKIIVSAQGQWAPRTMYEIFTLFPLVTFLPTTCKNESEGNIPALSGDFVNVLSLSLSILYLNNEIEVQPIQKRNRQCCIVTETHQTCCLLFVLLFDHAFWRVLSRILFSILSYGRASGNYFAVFHFSLFAM